MLESYVRLTLGSYVIKPGKLEVTSGLRYKNHVRITSGSNVRFTSGNYIIKLCKWEQKNTQSLRNGLRNYNVIKRNFASWVAG